MYPNTEMAKKLARERNEAMHREAQQHRLLKEAGLEFAKPFRRKLAFLLTKLAQRLDADITLEPKHS